MLARELLGLLAVLADLPPATSSSTLQPTNVFERHRFSCMMPRGCAAAARCGEHAHLLLGVQLDVIHQAVHDGLAGAEVDLLLHVPHTLLQLDPVPADQMLDPRQQVRVGVGRPRRLATARAQAVNRLAPSPRCSCWNGQSGEGDAADGSSAGAAAATLS